MTLDMRSTLTRPIGRPRLRGGLRPARGRGPATVTGLAIEPGEVVAAQVRPGARPVLERAVAGELPHDLLRDGEVADPERLGGWLKDFFAAHRLPTAVRAGLCSPRAVMRTIDLPPLQDAGDIAAALRMQAPEHIAMPLADAVMDHHTLGIVQTPDGPRTRVVLAAARREPVTQLLAALRRAGLRPVGIDLPAFALVRALHRPDGPPALYANVSGATTLAIARGAACELTRVSPVDLTVLAERLAEREGVPVGEARPRIAAFDPAGDDDAALAVLDGGLAELADDVRNTIEFHAGTAEQPVAEVVLTGAAAAIPNIATVLEQRIGLPVAPGAAETGPGAADGADPRRACIAAGLAVEEVVA